MPRWKHASLDLPSTNPAPRPRLSIEFEDWTNINNLPFIPFCSTLPFNACNFEKVNDKNYKNFILPDSNNHNNNTFIKFKKLIEKC